MSEHERIWLEPAPGADEDYGRQWAQHSVWTDGVEYVRVDIAEREHQDFRLQNDREWHEKLKHAKGVAVQEREGVLAVLKQARDYVIFATGDESCVAVRHIDQVIQSLSHHQTPSPPQADADRAGEECGHPWSDEFKTADECVSAGKCLCGASSKRPNPQPADEQERESAA